jgi:ribonuclease VapC
VSAILVDSSALFAILAGEPEDARLMAALAAAEHRVIGTFSLLECSVAIARRKGPGAAAWVRQFQESFRLRVHPFGEAQALEAVRAAERFGKGHHRAALNLGNCCTYAAARVLDLPVLQKGDDFARCDLVLVPW